MGGFPFLRRLCPAIQHKGHEFSCPFFCCDVVPHAKEEFFAPICCNFPRRFKGLFRNGSQSASRIISVQHSRVSQTTLAGSSKPITFTVGTHG